MTPDQKKAIQEANQKLQEENKIKYCCAPIDHQDNCNGNILQAHSVSKCLGLNIIKNTDNEVYHYPPYSNLYALDKENGIYHVKKVNIKSASVAPMFCQTHDLKLFKPIENNSFELNQENCFLLAYRATCLEYFKTNNRHYIGEEKKSDVATYKQFLDTALINKNFDALDHYIFELYDNNLLTSTFFTPGFNFKGKEIQDVTQKDPLKPILINSIRYNNNGYLIFSFKKEDSSFFLQYFDGLITMNDRFKKAQVLTNYMFKMFENIYWNIYWWDSLKPTRRDELFQLMQPANLLIQPDILKSHRKISHKNDKPAFYILKGYFLSET